MIYRPCRAQYNWPNLCLAYQRSEVVVARHESLILASASIREVELWETNLTPVVE